MFFIFQYFVHVHELRNLGVILRFAFFTNDFVHVHGNKKRTFAERLCRLKLVCLGNVYGL